MQRCNYNSLQRNINIAWKELRHHPRKETKGSDGLSISDFISDEQNLLRKIKDRLKSGSFHFSPLRPVRIDGGKREILIATVDDRIVGKALLKTILPKLKRYATRSNYCPIVRTYGHVASSIGVPRAVQDMQNAFANGQHYIFETDIIDFFGSINKRRLLDVIKGHISDQKVLKLIEEIVIFEKWNCDPDDYNGEELIGIAQGSALSPLFATIYLHDFDRQIEKIHNVKLIRYVDDLVILCDSRKSANEAYPLVRDELKKLGLQIHPLGKESKGRIKTNIRDVKIQPVVFLGLTFNMGQVTIARKKMNDILDDVRFIVHASKPSLLEKVKRVRNKIDGCVQQYKPRPQPHYNTKDQLNALIRASQVVIDDYYHQAYRGILKQSPFANATEQQKGRFKKFLGLDITDLILD